MAKVIRCSDLGMQCNYLARAETEQEVLSHAAEHVRQEHGMDDSSPEALSKAKAAVRDEA